MVDQGMEPGKGYYVAPAEPPTSRRPPITEVGIISWLRKNLFASVLDSILTLLTMGVVIAVLWNIMVWAVTEAQWEVAFLNQRIIMSGLQFPIEELWRTKLLAMLVIFLGLMSVAIWGKVTRTVVVIVLAISAALIIIPRLAELVDEPLVHFYHDSTYKLHEVNFIAEPDQQYTFIIEPLTEPEEFALSRIDGYIENDNQQSNTSFDAFNAAINGVNPLAGREQTIDPSLYDLSVAVAIRDRDGRVLAQSPFSQGSTESLTFVWSLAGVIEPDDTEEEIEARSSLAPGWYSFAVIRDEDPAYNSTGMAFIEIGNAEVYRSTIGAQRERRELYGPEPELDCNNCNTSLNRTDMRFEGQRNFGQWVSLQLSPFILEIRAFMLLGFVVGAVGYFTGTIFRQTALIADEVAKPIERNMLMFASLWFVGYIGVRVTNQIHPEPILSVIQNFIMVTILITLFIYALVLFLRKGENLSARGMSILWLLSIPVSIYILTGFQPSAEAVAAGIEPPLPFIETSAIGGLVLTVILSIVAILVSFPIGIFLALGRQSNLPIISVLCTIFIEVVRGVPLITLLFMGSLIVPFFGFGLGDVDLVIRIIVVLTLFTSAYMAEVIRGGLQIIPKGQLEASYALGLNNFWTTVLIVLPQALRAVIPAIMGQAVSLFKDTTLVYLIGLFDVLGVVYAILGDSQTGYLRFPREGYLYLAIIYFIISYIMADISRRIERSGSGAVRRETM